MRLTQGLRRCRGIGRAAIWALALACASGTAAGALTTPRIKPPAPGPAYTTPADLAQLKEIQEAISRREWSRARALSETIGDPMAKGLAQWFYYYAEDPLVSVPAADAFLDSHPDWPAASKMQLHAEKRMPTTLAPDAVLDFFETRDPLTGDGALALARAQFASGADDAATMRIRDAWVNLDFTLAVEQRLLSQYARLLSPEHHAARADRLLWSREVTAARRLFARLDPAEKRKAEARAALLLNAASAPKLYDALSGEERADPGVMLAAVRYYRRAGEEPRAIAIAREAPADPTLLRNPSRWWEERQLLMRWALTERQYSDAYAMAAGHGLEPRSVDFSEAEFNAGWIALRHLGAPDRAETHFMALAASVSAPISLARAFYWLGRAAEARGDANIAKGRYGQAAAFIYTFYGQLAAEKLGGEVRHGFAEPITPTPEEKARFSSRPAVAALRILSDLKADQPFLVFAYHVDDQLESAGEYVELGRLADRLGATHVTVRAGKVGIGRGALAPEVAYPLIPVPEEAMRFAPPEIILGLARQESEFNPRAFSHAGARGLMQLIPSTAQLTARKEGLRYNRNDLIGDPYYNLIIGSAHLSHLMERFNGSLIMTFAAYNAGPQRVDQWIERYGDPRSDDVDPVDWIEQIPFAETRNYVQRVLENTQVYRARLSDGAIAGRLAADLEIGGANGRAGAVAMPPGAGVLPPIPDRTVRIAADGPHLPPPPAPAAAASGDAADAAPEANESTLIQPRARARSPARPSRGNSQRSRGAAPRGGEESAPPVAPSPIVFAAEPSDAPLAGTDGAVRHVEGGPPRDGAAPADPERAIEAFVPTDAAPPGLAEPDVTTEECRTYRDYIAETDREEASADDLNAGMRAEFRSGGPRC